jgi:hypothetical protein
MYVVACSYAKVSTYNAKLTTKKVYSQLKSKSVEITHTDKKTLTKNQTSERS